MELRTSGVEQLGQVRLAILETNGQISLYFYEDDDVKADSPFFLLALPSVLPLYPGTSMPASAAVQSLRYEPGINNYASLRKCRMVEGQPGKKSPDSNYVGFMTSSWQILFV